MTTSLSTRDLPKFSHLHGLTGSIIMATAEGEFVVNINTGEPNHNMWCHPAPTLATWYSEQHRPPGC